MKKDTDGEDSGLLHFPQVTRTQEWLKNGFEDEVQAGTWLFFFWQSVSLLKVFSFLEISKHDAIFGVKKTCFWLWFWLIFHDLAEPIAAQSLSKYWVMPPSWCPLTLSENHSFGFPQKWQL